MVIYFNYVSQILPNISLSIIYLLLAKQLLAQLFDFTQQCGQYNQHLVLKFSLYSQLHTHFPLFAFRNTSCITRIPRLFRFKTFPVLPTIPTNFSRIINELQLLVVNSNLGAGNVGTRGQFCNANTATSIVNSCDDVHNSMVYEYVPITILISSRENDHMYML